MRLDYKGIRYISRIISLLIIYKLITKYSLVVTKTSTIKGVSFIINFIFPYSYKLLNT